MTEEERSGARSVRADLPAVLARQVSALADATGARRIVAWGRGAGGALEVLAARVEGAALSAPSEAHWRAIAQLSGPTDLESAGDPALVKLVTEQGVDVVAPLRGEEPEPIAVLLVGDAPDVPRRRLLAALASTVAQGLRPAMAAATLEQLARLDGAVQRIDRLAAVGGLVTEMVHEIRNPLVSIKTFLHLLGEERAEGSAEDDASADPSEFRDVAIEELRRIERLLEAVSQHARPPSAASAEGFGEVDAAFRSVTQLATLRAVAHGVRFEAANAEDVDPVAMAGDALRQVLLNLALNAIEATPSGGTVRIHASATPDAIVIAVDDEGPGIPEELRARLFEPFVSTKAQPSGLGLAITQRLVEDAGGTIEASTREEGGARFLVTLPVARA